MYRDLRGRERSAGTFASRRQADRAWQQAESKMDAGQVGDPKKGRQTLRSYVLDDWLPHHVIEATTRERYVYLINRHILSDLGGMRMIDLMPGHVREWVTALQAGGVKPPTIKQAKAVLDAILTTALNDQVVFLHAGKGVKTPVVPKRPPTLLSAAQFDLLHDTLPDDAMRLLVETGIESGLRWGELTELRPKDIDLGTGVLTVSRAVVHLKSGERPEAGRFLVKDYPKDKQWRRLRLADHMITKLEAHITDLGLGPDDLLFAMPDLGQPRRRRRPETLPDPTTLGMTVPNDAGRRYRHGTTTAYGAGRCRCDHCRDAMAAYRAARRGGGQDHPRPTRLVDTDGHISNDWFRVNVWDKAIAKAELPQRITPHGLRHAHASWLLAGGADLQIVKERLGHASITTTERYLHTLPGADQAALDALTAVRGSRTP
jgi:integrase